LGGRARLPNTGKEWEGVWGVGDGPNMARLSKDVLPIPAKSTSEVEFTAEHPGNTLFHCHQQDHMDRGFMMVFRYA
jgi:FtsP/CotA-like multicopper oxidase with cupredoxin domain